MQKEVEAAFEAKKSSLSSDVTAAKDYIDVTEPGQRPEIGRTHVITQVTNELTEVARLAIVLGCVGKALAWERALLGLDEREMDGHGDAVAAWLMEFEGRLEA